VKSKAEDDGKVGTAHDKLVAKERGYYRKLFDNQTF